MTAPAPLRVALTSLGCKVNFAEMAELAGVLAAAGCDVVPEHEHADIRVLNSCTVTLQADATTRQRLRRLRRFDPQAHIVLTGCSVDGNPDQYLRTDASGKRGSVPGVDAVFANAEKHEVAGHILAMPAAHVRVVADGTEPHLRSRAFLKVQDGCDHRCTYCIVWRARGESVSVAVDTVLDRARAAVQAGYRELVLCGVDLGSYGRDVGTNLAALVERLLTVIGDGVRVRLSSINANDVSPALIGLNAHPRLCSHWHMPLQSGSDRVLRAMHRGYRRAHYLRVVRELREQAPETEFTTDIMVAFPGETDDDHRETLALVDEVGYLSCHVFRWSPRPDTPAESLQLRVSDANARRRSTEVRRAAARTGAAARERAVGRVHEVVWDELRPGGAHGLAATYHEVVVETQDPVQVGALANVRALSVEGEQLRGTLLPR